MLQIYKLSLIIHFKYKEKIQFLKFFKTAWLFLSRLPLLVIYGQGKAEAQSVFKIIGKSRKSRHSSFLNFSSDVINMQCFISFTCTIQQFNNSICYIVLIKIRVFSISLTYFKHPLAHLPSGNCLFSVVKHMFCGLSLFPLCSCLVS